MTPTRRLPVPNRCPQDSELGRRDAQRRPRSSRMALRHGSHKLSRGCSGQIAECVAIALGKRGSKDAQPLLIPSIEVHFRSAELLYAFQMGWLN